MNTLDNPTLIDPSDVSMLPTALRYGLIGGAVSIIMSLISNLAGLTEGGNTAVSIAIGIVALLIYIIMQFLGVKHHRDNELGGYISFGRGFGLSFLIAILISAISAIWNFIYLSFIDPDMMERVREAAYDTYEEMGFSDEQIEQSMSVIEATTSPSAQMIAGLIFGAIMGLICGLIISAILKRNAPFS